MNPYFLNQFPYQGQPQSYGYPNPNFQGYSHPTQPPSIEAMYTTVQPYNNKQFLLSTFGPREDYIKVFLTLSHEDKLMMFMLMQQKKMYGQIMNKQSYQRLLREIAQKVQNYNNFHNRRVDNHNKENQKKKELESKIDDIVEKTFEKLKINTKEQEQLKKEEKNKHEELVITLEYQEEDEEQWVGVEFKDQTPEPPQDTNYRAKEHQIRISEHKKKEEMTASMPIFNVFKFDSQIEKALTQQIGIKSSAQDQKKSIWDLELGDDQLKNSQPNIKQIFKSKTEQVPIVVQQTKQSLLVAEKQENIRLPGVDCTLSQQQQEPGDYFDLPQSYSANTNQLYFSQRNEGIDNFGLLSIQNLSKSEHSIQQDFSKIHNSVQSQLMPSLSPQKQAQQIQMVQPVELEPIIEPQPHFSQLQPEIASGETKISQGEENKFEVDSKQTQFYEEKQANSDFLFAETQMQNQQQYQLSTQSKLVNLDFDLLGGFESTSQPVNNKQMQQDLNLQSIQIKNIDQPQSKQEQTQAIASSQTSQISEPVYYHSQFTPETYKIDSPKKSTLLFINKPENYTAIDHLKIELDSKNKQFVLKALKSKSFQCDTSFFEIMMNYLRSIGLENSPEYIHFKQQYQLVKMMHQLADKYTKAVEEDQQELVTSTIRQTKELFKSINQNSSKTQEYTQSLLSSDYLQKGFTYKFAKILVDSRIPTEAISKTSSQQSQKQIINSFEILYVLQKLNSLTSLVSNIQKIVHYVNIQYEKYRTLDSQTLLVLEEQAQQNIVFENYIKGLVRMFEICQRMIALLKAAGLKSHCNIVKTLKIAKDLRTKYHHYHSPHLDALLPEQYQDALKEGVKQNKDLYELHSIFAELSEKSPICRVCLLPLGVKGGKKGGQFYHYSCFNLLSQVDKPSTQ